MLTGDLYAVGAIQNWLLEVRKGKQKYLSDRFRGEVSQGGVDNGTFAGTTDFKIVAREVRVNILEHLPGKGQESPILYS